MKQTNWEFNYSAARDSGCADDGGKVAAILKWDRAAKAAAQNQTQQVFRLSRNLFYWRSLWEKS